MFQNALNCVPGPGIEPAVEGLVGAHRVGKELAVVVGDAGVLEVEVGHVAVHAEGGVRLVGGEGKVLEQVNHSSWEDLNPNYD